MLVESNIFWRGSSILEKRDSVFFFPNHPQIISTKQLELGKFQRKAIKGRIRNGKDTIFELLDLSK